VGVDLLFILFYFRMWVLIGYFIFFLYVGGLNWRIVWQRC
jgi:hypothetical protein